MFALSAQLWLIHSTLIRRHEHCLLSGAVGEVGYIPVFRRLDIIVHVKHLSLLTKITSHNTQYIVYSKDTISCEQRRLTCDFR
jgi:hypothetical protein